MSEMTMSLTIDELRPAAIVSIRQEHEVSEADANALIDEVIRMTVALNHPEAETDPCSTAGHVRNLLLEGFQENCLSWYGVELSEIVRLASTHVPLFPAQQRATWS